MAKGDFTPVKLVELQTKLEQVWKDPQFAKFYTPKGETLKAIRENQTATFPALQDPSKEHDVAVKWADFCDDTAITETNADSCDNNGCDEPDPKTKTYANNTFLSDCFTITEEDYQTTVIDMDETIAKGMASKIKNIIELLNTKIIAVADANAGVNPLADQFTTVDGNTVIPKSDFNIETVYPYWIEMLTILRSTRSFILDGRNLFQARVLAMARSLNDDGKVERALFEMFPYYNDLIGFMRAGVVDNTYLIDAGAMAVQSRQKYPRIPKEVSGDRTKYSIPLPGYPGLGLDVLYQQTCVDGSEVFSWKFKFRGLIAVNPFLCDAGNTGIWAFTAGANA